MIETEMSKQLLPGIPDEMTLDHICTKLPWRAFHMLSSVNRLWLEAIQSRKVYDARVRSNSAETLVLIAHISGELNKNDNPYIFRRSTGDFRIALYSMTEDRCYQLPDMPHFGAGLVQSFQLVSLNGKIYCLEGDPEFKGREVYELDLAGQQQWKQCESMQEPRWAFGCAVMDEKIYVCGGELDKGNRNAKCDVYDPEENVWASIADMKAFRYFHCITTLGGDMFASGGYIYHDDTFQRGEEELQNVNANLNHAPCNQLHRARYLEVYNPGKDEWRIVCPFGRQDLETLFVAQGKFHLISDSGIHVLDGTVESNIWRELHSFMLCEIVGLEHNPVLAVAGELLRAWKSPKEDGKFESCLLRSTGFGSKTKELVWEKANCPLTLLKPSCMCSIQL